MSWARKNDPLSTYAGRKSQQKTAGDRLFNKPKKPTMTNSKLQFALDFEMITQEEYDWIMEGNMALSGNQLTNLNIDKARAGFDTGTTVLVYNQRSLDVISRKWMGLD